MQGSVTELEVFISSLNCNSCNIKLTYKHGRCNMDFLDILFQIDGEGFVQTDLFRKKTAVNALLHAKSSHPRSLVKSIPTGQFLRTKLICSQEYLFEKQTQELSERFEVRGYNKSWIKAGYIGAKNSRRDDLLKEKGKHHKPRDTQVRFISTFHSRHAEMRGALSKFWDLLTIDPVLKLYLPKQPSITYRRSKNLRDSLVCSDHMGTQPEYIFGSKGSKWGCYSCGKLFYHCQYVGIHLKEE